LDLPPGLRIFNFLRGEVEGRIAVFAAKVRRAGMFLLFDSSAGEVKRRSRNACFEPMDYD